MGAGYSLMSKQYLKISFPGSILRYSDIFDGLGIALTLGNYLSFRDTHNTEINYSSLCSYSSTTTLSCHTTLHNGLFPATWFSRNAPFCSYFLVLLIGLDTTIRVGTQVSSPDIHQVLPQAAF